MKRMFLTIAAIASAAGICGAQELEMLPYGDFENWTVRVIKESAVVGGDSVEVYAIDKDQVIRGNKPYLSETSPWSTSNTYAIVSGVTKVNVNTRPGEHDGGKCVVMSTEMMSFRVLGALKIEVLTAGAIYLGRIHEPIRGMDDAYSYIDMGIPFTKKPKSLVMDYSAKIGNSGTVSKISGVKKKTFDGYDKAQIFVKLQRRWEENGKIYAERVATAEMLIDSTTDWVEGYRLDLEYGKPEDEEKYTEYSRLNDIYYAMNSEGEMVNIEEVGWAEEGTEPTHLVIYMASGCLGVYCGELGNELRVDNLYFEY